MAITLLSWVCRLAGVVLYLHRAEPPFYGQADAGND